ncbi:hypothetical protein ACFPME_11690, partial [Rhodanobacter umsongensis]
DVSLAQEADDLFFGKPLLHVQSPSVGGLDSKPRCYSKEGGRRLREKMKEGLSELRKQRDIGDLILSPAAVLLVTTLLQELEDSSRATYWQEHLEMRLVAIDKCLLQMRLIARGDLSVD